MIKGLVDTMAGVRIDQAEQVIERGDSYKASGGAEGGWFTVCMWAQICRISIFFMFLLFITVLLFLYGREVLVVGWLFRTRRYRETNSTTNRLHLEGLLLLICGCFLFLGFLNVSLWWPHDVFLLSSVHQPPLLSTR